MDRCKTNTVRWPLGGMVLPLAVMVFTGAAHADAVRGEQLLKRNMCPACHAIKGKGGKVGPGLDGVALRHSRDWIVQQLKDPIVNNPKSLMRKFHLSDEDIHDLVDYLQSLK